MIDPAARRLALAREILTEFGWLSGCIDPECAQCMDEISRLTIKLDQYGDALARAIREEDAKAAESLPRVLVDPRYNPLAGVFNEHGHPIEEDTKKRIATAIRALSDASRTEDKL